MKDQLNLTVFTKNRSIQRTKMAKFKYHLIKKGYLDWVDRPQHHMGLYGILQLLQYFHLPLETLKLGWIRFPFSNILVQMFRFLIWSILKFRLSPLTFLQWAMGVSLPLSWKRSLRLHRSRFGLHEQSSWLEGKTTNNTIIFPSMRDNLYNVTERNFPDTSTDFIKMKE